MPPPSRSSLPTGPVAGRVLVVDDEKSTRLIAERVLAADGHEVTTAGTVAEAMRHARTVEFDLIVLDLGLPDGDGLDVCRQIREFSDVYIMILTGRSGEPDRVEGLNQGADDYVLKPFSPPELAARVRAAMRRLVSAAPEAQPDDAYPFGPGLELDRTRRLLHVEGHTVSLTSIEFTMFELLFERGGQVVTRDELATTCWGPNSVDGGHLVTVHMANLRKKVADTDLEFVAIRGVGYQLARTVSH